MTSALNTEVCEDCENVTTPGTLAMLQILAKPDKVDPLSFAEARPTAHQQRGGFSTFTVVDPLSFAEAHYHLPRATTNAVEDFRIAFVTDCSAHQRWMAFQIFNSARSVGQQEPIIWLRMACTKEKLKRWENDMEVASVLYQQAEILDINGASGEDFNLGGGVPSTLATWFSTDSSLRNDTVIALIEGDFFFLERFRIDDLHSKGKRFEPKQHQYDIRAGIKENRGVAAYWQCCDGFGPPYVLSVGGWRMLMPEWQSQMNKEMQGGTGWGADQVCFGRAVKFLRMQFNLYTHFSVTEFDVQEGWDLVRHALMRPSMDVCSTKRVGEQSTSGALPSFLHIVRPWTVGANDSEAMDSEAMDSGAWGFSKYQVPPGWKKAETTDGILECDMPLFAEPPATLLQDFPSEYLSAWALCVVHSRLNEMLLTYKENVCKSGFNSAKALKMSVPLNWTNRLLPGAEEGVLNKKRITWMERCAEEPECG